MKETQENKRADVRHGRRVAASAGPERAQQSPWPRRGGDRDGRPEDAGRAKRTQQNRAGHHLARRQALKGQSASPQPSRTQHVRLPSGPHEARG